MFVRREVSLPIWQPTSRQTPRVVPMTELPRTGRNLVRDQQSASCQSHLIVIHYPSRLITAAEIPKRMSCFRAQHREASEIRAAQCHHKKQGHGCAETCSAWRRCIFFLQDRRACAWTAAGLSGDKRLVVSFIEPHLQDDVLRAHRTQPLSSTSTANLSTQRPQSLVLSPAWGKSGHCGVCNSPRVAQSES